MQSSTARAQLPTYTAQRYVQPLREGGSLPAIVDTDGGLFVVKFRGAGQGPKALIAEIIAGSIAQHLGLPVPELALIEIGAAFGRAEPDPEIQEILRASHGVNVGLRYLDGAFNYDGFAAGEFIPQALAAEIVWFDAFLTNPDRTHRNPNILIFERHPWLIDHGAALYAHHSWSGVDAERTRTPFPLIKDHVLLRAAADLNAADARLQARLDSASLARLLAGVPDALLLDPIIAGEFSDAAAARRRYHDYLLQRLAAPRAFVAEAVQARETRLHEPVQRRRARR
ncbi:MAG TPA: HipA family kinase [Longimicrobiales bacterium]